MDGSKSSPFKFSKRRADGLDETGKNKKNLERKTRKLNPSTTAYAQRQRKRLWEVSYLNPQLNQNLEEVKEDDNQGLCKVDWFRFRRSCDLVEIVFTESFD
ncbi:hypothetical protein DY000_02005677 [Brassica cretica]|uniref:Uncharacterized protein n=1 Tax=Brassica cretica TaxID=69181 RepID=A0ABQ7C1T7_BRACR|nr:hypothetical protein DY000_02005677 [Brassica cretica]